MRTDRALFFGRVLVALIFVLSGFEKFTAFDQTAGYVAAHGLPAPHALLLIAMIVELVGGLSLMVGFLAPYAAVVLFLYLIPTTVIFHNFWAFEGMDRQMQLVNFLKNLAIMGGLVYVATVGAGAYSFDRRLGRRSPVFARIYRPLRPVEIV